MFTFKKPKNELELYLKTNANGKIPSIPDEMYTLCDACRGAVLTSDLADNMKVCPKCGYHYRLGARQRLTCLCDENSFTEFLAEEKSRNPLGFEGYPTKLQNAENLSRENEAVITGTCHIGGIPCAIFVMEADFMMGSMGCVVGEKVTSIFEYAAEHALPVVGVTVSGGARMQEGILSLMQMAKTSGAVKKHSDAGLLYITLLTNPTTGGVTASFAMQGDIIISEPGALVGFAGPRVIEQTTRQKLPAGFQKAEFLQDKGFIDLIAERKDLKDIIIKILKMHTKEARAQ